MSILEKITSILDGIEEMNGKLDRIMGKFEGISRINLTGEAFQREREALKPEPKKEVRIHSPGFEDYKPEPKEEVEQDFSKVTVMNQTELALLVVKNGYQQWLAKSLIQGGGDGYDNGNVYDVTIVEISPKSKKPTKWVYKKWEPFEVFKN